jgi:hypothetical protein
MKTTVLDLTELTTVFGSGVIQRANVNFHGVNIPKNWPLSSDLTIKSLIVE